MDHDTEKQLRHINAGPSDHQPHQHAVGARMTRVIALMAALSGCTLGTSMALGDGVREANQYMERSFAPQRVARCQQTYWGTIECRESWR